MGTMQKLDKQNVEDIVSLSPMQEGMLFHYLNNPESEHYFEQMSLSLSGEINTELLKKAWAFVISGNEMLRAIFRWDKLEKPVQVILKNYELPIRELDISEAPEQDKAALLEDIRIRDRQEKLDIGAEPFRITLVKAAADRYEMIISNHHILYDGWSNGIIMKEFLAAYESLMGGQEPKKISKNRFREFIKWYQTQDKGAQEKYWRDYLAGFDTKTILPIDNKRADIKGSVVKHIYKLDRELTASINDFAREQKLTMATVLYGAWGILLQRYNDTNDVVFGTTVSGRSTKVKGIEDIVGLFINTLPFRVSSEKEEQVSTLLAKVDRMLKEREEYENTPLVEIKACSEIDAKENLFDSIVVIENYPLDKALAENKGKLSVDSFKMFEMTNFQLTLGIMAFDDIELDFIYNDELFKNETIQRLCGHFENILRAMLREPSMRLSELELLSEGERNILLYDFNNTKTDYPKDRTIVELFEEQVQRTPDNIALKHEARQLSYRELNEKANQLARLLRSKGVGSDKIVGMIMDRSIEMLIGIMAIFKAGGAYLPIDATFPEERIEYMLSDCEVELLLTQSHLSDKIDFYGQKIDLDDSSLYEGDASNLEHINKPQDLAYVIYTSGSTGKPKGNLTMHYNIVRVVKDTNYIDIRESDHILQLSNYAFDGSTFDIYGALLNGAKLVLISKETLLDIDRLSSLLREESITVFFVTTALFNTLTDINVEAFETVRKVLFGGERVSVPHVRKALEYMGKDRILHVYGPTESTVYATAYAINEIDDSLGTIPIGSPLANTEIYILDKSDRLQPIGIPGELCISGDGLARGYLKRPELTEEKFVQNPFAPGERMYRTGDLARWLPDGNIEFIGRIDHQVKIRGFRIELGEIESELLGHPDIKEAIVIDREDANHNKYICAYIVGGRELQTSELKQYLAKDLPDYMIPLHIIQLEKMPLNTSGKVDRRQLPVPDTGITAVEYEAPSNEIEEKLAEIWKSILGAERVGINDSFFELGGHSLKATAMVSKIHKELNVQIPLKAVFAAPTIKELARCIKGAEESEYTPIKPVEEKELYPMSDSQRRMFVQQQFEGIGVSYNMPLAMLVEGRLDRELFETAFRELIRRHESLRTSFEAIDGEFVQRVHREIAFEIPCIDGRAEELQSYAAAFVKPFDLSRAPILRAQLIRLAEDRYFFLMDMHHIISDGVSVNIIMKEFAELYQGKALPEQKIQFRDFAAYQEELEASETMQRQEQYWAGRLSGDIPVLNMPTDFMRADIRTFEGDTVNFFISGEITNKLNTLAQKKNTTLNTVLFSIYDVLLNRYTEQEELIVGSLVAGRRHPDTANIVGMFNNFLPIRSTVNTDKTFSELLNANRESILGAYDNQEYAFDKMVENWAGRTDRARNPFFDTMLILHNQLEGGVSMEAGGIRLTRQDLGNRTSKLDFKLDVFMDGVRLSCILEYNIKLFRKETMERFAGHFTNIINEVLADPDKSIKEIEMLSEHETQQILREFNDTRVDYPSGKTLYQMFEEQVEKTPDRIAVIYEDKNLSYKELNEKANRLARTLRQKGVGPDSIVGLMVERSLEMPIAIMAIEKAGGAYLPISPEYPEDRISYMLEDSNAGVLITQTRFMDRVNFCGAVVNAEDEASYAADGTNIEHISGPHNLAYVIYTSGSTGKPKGAMIEHHSAVNRLMWMHGKYPIGEDDVILQKTPFTFDVSVWELFWWSLVGSRVCFLVQGGEKDPEAIVRAIEKNKITVMHFVPSMLNIFLEYIEGQTDLSRLASLRQVFASGEALTLPQVERFNRLLNRSCGAKLANLYGPTEATVDVSYFDCSEGQKLDVIPIGKPIDNIALLVVSKDNRLMPVGVPGELCISGVGVCRGYLGRPELTAEKFIPNPFIPGERMYRTGDLTRWMPDGNIEYLGRIDHQVKIRGFRIELGEIEAQLLKHEAVREAVVVAKDDPSGTKFLCAYYVSERELAVAELRAHIMEELPEYMVPSYFIALDKMPLSTNGKIDRKALPEPDGNITTGTQYVAPRNDIERRLADIWQEVLKLEKAGINDSFFELGGHSLKAANLVTKIHKEFNVEISLSQIFKTPTIKELAERISGAEQNIYSAIQPIEDKEYYPLSSAQQRLFILNRMESEATTYNLPQVMLVEGRLDRTRFEESFRKLIERHETLRTSFEMTGGENPVQRVHDKADFAMDYMEADESGAEKLLKDFIRPFELGRAPLLRVALVKLSEEKHILMFDMHHIISDGVSIVVLVQEFISLYQGAELPDLRIQYRDFAAWQNELFASDTIRQQEQYWLEAFSGELPVLNMPTDFPRPSIQSYEGKKLGFPVDSEIAAGLRKLAADTGATLYMVLLALYNTLLSKYTGQEDIVVGSPIVGRPHADLENLIGMFVNTLVLRNYPIGSKSFTELLAEVKQSSLRAFENQDYQFEQLVDKLNLAKDMSRNPLFDTMLVLQNMSVPETKLEELSFRPYAFENNVSKFDLTLEVIERGEEIILNFEYCTRLFRQETIERLAGHFMNIAGQAIEAPEKKLSELDMLSEAERRQIFEEFNDTKADYPRDKTLYQIFEENVEKYPDRVAVMFEEKSLTYRELNERANQLARLLRQKGVKADSIVGLMLERSLEMAIGIMAIEKAGGAYLPISPEYPGDRVSYMLEDSSAGVLLTQERYMDKASFGGATINVEDESLYTGDASNLEHISGPRNLAYVIYTSGSTGKPKGAMLEHHSAINRILWMHKSYPIGENDVILQKTPFTFDVSVWELFWWSLVGSRVCFLQPGGEKDPGAMVKAIEKYKITTMHFVPSMLNIFLEYVEGLDNLEALRSLRQVFASGEALTVPQVEKFNRLLNAGCGTKLINLYGPTEATVDVSYFNCSEGQTPDVIPIGKPIDNITLLVLSKDNNLLPVGVPGELCISGVGVGRGYLGRPELTAEKFIPNPFMPGERLYRTGDLTRWMPDGNIEYLGRIDHQVKIRGFRIELGEIEAQLLKHEAVKETVVVAKEDKSGSKYLCAYLVSDRELTVAELKEHILRDLPDYMVPAYFIRLEAMPLSANGKIDRKQLPEPDGNINTGVEYVAPRNEIEQKLVEIWKDLLGVEIIGINDNFFDLGGNSLLLVRMHARIEDQEPGRVKVTDIFANPTISKLAEFMEKGSAAAPAVLPIKYIELPADYFNEGNTGSQTGAFKFQLAELEKLQAIAAREAAEVEDILLSAWTFLLSQVSGKKQLAVQTLLEESNRVSSLDIDLSTAADFAKLFRLISEARKQAGAAAAYQLQDTARARLRKESREVAPLVYRRNLMNARVELLDVYDILLEIREEAGTLQFKCEFNARRLREDKLEALVNGYLKLVKMIIGSYQQK